MTAIELAMSQLREVLEGVQRDLTALNIGEAKTKVSHLIVRTYDIQGMAKAALDQVVRK